MSELRQLEAHFMEDADAREAVLARLASEQASELVCSVEAFYKRFVIFPPGASLPISLWTVATFMYEAFETLPYLDFQSPTKRCGKPARRKSWNFWPQM